MKGRDRRDRARGLDFQVAGARKWTTGALGKPQAALALLRKTTLAVWGGARRAIHFGGEWRVGEGKKFEQSPEVEVGELLES